MEATVDRAFLAGAIRAAYHGDRMSPDADGPGPGQCTDCCWGNTCPAHAADAVMSALGATTYEITTNGVPA